MANTSVTRPTNALRRRLLLVLAVLLVGIALAAVDVLWDGFWQDIEINDVTKPQTFELRKGRSGYVYALDYRASGQLDGEAELILHIDGGLNYETMPLSGKVNVSRGGDYYADTAILEYRPHSVRGGNLQITYLFRR